jgi:GTP cyclohydrolase II
MLCDRETIHNQQQQNYSCDCSQQLKMSLKHVAKYGGAVVYLQQEGRGIGLANKVAAYALQDIGLDTVDANLHLGFPEDCRHYGAIPSILHDMKIGSIKLMTNNPRKVVKLRALGVKIEDTVPMVVAETNRYNHRYLEAKHDRMDHQNLKHLFPDNAKTRAASTLVGEAFVTETGGTTMAKNAVQVSMTTLGENAENDEEAGCIARDDGYCFGRESVEEAIAATKAGKMVVVVDDMNRENEGDLIMAADACTPEDMAFIVRYSSGVICIAMDEERMDQLELPQMITNNEDPKNTAFTVTVDATSKHGT